MASEPTGYLSMIGFFFIEPLFTLVETLEARSPPAPNEVQTSGHENGYSNAIVVLSVLLLESAINRIRYFRKQEGRRPTAAGYFATISADTELATAVNEVFAMRDAIVHNHVWEACIYWDRQEGMKFVRPPQIREGYGDTRFKQVMDPESRLSRHLKLNLFPPRIWRRDAYLVLKTVGHALQALESLSEGHRSVADDRFEFRGRDMSLYDVIAELHADHGRE